MNAIGIDLGGTQIKAVVVSESGEILDRQLRPTRDGTATGHHWSNTIQALANELGRDLPVGISAPGLASRDQRSIAYMPGRLHGLEHLDWTDLLGRKSLVPVLNDAQASLLGEVWIGAASGVRDCFMLTLGTGVGGAAICDGHLLRGHLGRAGHLGHICLDVNGPPDIVRTPGSLEDAIGNHNVVQRSGGRFETTHALLAAYRQGDPQGTEIWLGSVRSLACAIASLINVLDPEVVIIGGGIGQAGPDLFRPLQLELDQIEWRPGGAAVRLVQAALGEWAGAIGAARTALQQTSKPTT
jgi:glucokinase